MVTDDTSPCPNPDCWCRKDKVEPIVELSSKDFNPRLKVEWDKYGYFTLQNEPLGGFDKDKKDPVTTIFDKPKTDTTSKPFAAFFWDDKNTPDWDEKWWSMDKAKDEEVRTKDPKTGGEKGQKLAELGAIDPASLMELARVAGYGSGKYARLNYMKGYKWSLSYDAMQRHLLLFWGGESFDPESGLHHLAHAAWHCMTLMSYDMRDLGTDDRYIGDPGMNTDW
jgi:hypothetical protein